jgi:DNA-binding NtrC family response regulator
MTTTEEQLSSTHWGSFKPKGSLTNDRAKKGVELMCDSWIVLVVSDRLENRKALTRILDSLPVSVIAAWTLVEAQKILARQEVDMVFCDEILPDGTYRDLLSMRSISKPCVVVSAQRSERGDRHEAVRQGAFELLRYPPEPTDVEFVVIRASRHLRRQNEYQVPA